MSRSDSAAPGDVELVGAAQAGSQDAFRDLVERHQRMVFSLAFAVSGRAGESSEIAQEVFVRAWQKLARLRSSASFRAWVCGITRNVIRRFLETRQSRMRNETDLVTSDAGLASDDASPLDQAIRREEQVLLSSALERVPEAYRVPLALHYQEQWTIEQIAEGLDLRINNVRQRLLRGRRLLRGEYLAALKARPFAQPRKGLTTAVLAAIALDTGRGFGAPSGVKMRWWSLASVAALGGLAALLVVGSRGGKSGHANPRSPASPSVASVARLRQLPLLTFFAQPTELPAPANQRTSPLFRFDFEDGLLPRYAVGGHVTDTCPPRPGNSFCFLAAVEVWRTQYWEKSDEGTSFGIWQLGFGDSQSSAPLFIYSDNLTLSFDYFLASEKSGMRIQLTRRRGSDGGRFPFRVRTPELRQGAWSHLDLALSRIRQGPTEFPPLEDGDEIHGLYIAIQVTKDNPLYVDNVMLHEVTSIIGRPVSR